MPRYFPSIPFTGSFLLLNFLPRYRNDEQVEHWIEKGSIIRTGTRSSFGRLPRGTSFGSKSAGMYLLRTLRSPMVESAGCGSTTEGCEDPAELLIMGNVEFIRLKP
ncbi:hypothetical protein ACHAWF_007358 [Thalassiosira exigua]